MKNEGHVLAEVNRPAHGQTQVPHTMIDNPLLLKAFGITRVGDITDLDVIGMPVWFATRPNSRGLSVSQGKGMTAERAKLSAVMEAIEGAVAEDTQRHVSDYGSLSEMRGRGYDVLPLEAISRVILEKFDPARERAWVKGHSARDDTVVVAPFELVGLDFRFDFPWDRDAFVMSSQGLAAGFDFDQAVLHAMLELIENEACTVVEAFSTRMTATRTVFFPKGQSADLDRLVDRLDALGLTPTFFDLTGSTGVPVILASLPRSLMTDNGPGKRSAAGIACRLSGAEAACSALQEAIQARLTHISGARDDLFNERYEADQDVRGNRWGGGSAIQWQHSLVLPDDVSKVPVWRRLADHLFSCGVNNLYLFRLETSYPDIVVVRVLGSGMATATASQTALSRAALASFLGT
ncbi:YcaO-like family protein [Neorhizobium sp. JUb45]|uniref:YcaO-like family protein n=1 Tax=Neorhizobium sp. JUb45 TaxID=2485113 RepID=UPI0010DD7E6B|nr:YcaO-like family protein [Neorhizobium sp. JUb45]TCR00529.1 ribosomal protein S12 methylthiotransferase accessory factor [Neorhizobium sp. JUb45]